VAVKEEAEANAEVLRGIADLKESNKPKAAEERALKEGRDQHGPDLYARHVKGSDNGSPSGSSDSRSKVSDRDPV
jgi:hypothetical protein